MFSVALEKIYSLNMLKDKPKVYSLGKYPNIPKEIEDLISADPKKIAASMANPVRGSSPSPFTELIYNDYAGDNGTKYKFQIDQREEYDKDYYITIFELRENAKIIKTRGTNKAIQESSSFPDDFKNYLNKFIKNIIFT